jgi:hypothetical protein
MHNISVWLTIERFNNNCSGDKKVTIRDRIFGLRPDNINRLGVINCFRLPLKPLIATNPKWLLGVIPLADIMG